MPEHRNPPGAGEPDGADAPDTGAFDGEAGDRRLTKTQKLVRILERLQDPDGVQAADLKARFAIDDRTLRRYLADLRALDIPLHSEGRGARRRLWIDPSYRRRGVQVDLLELVSLRFGRALFHFLEGTGFAQDMDNALSRISTLALGAPGIHLADALDRKFIAVPEHHKDHTRDRETLEDILSALLYQNPARAHYARVGGPTRAYELHPYTLAIFRQGLYLFALDVKADRVKTFAVDRFRHFERLRGEHFDYPDDYDPAEVVRDAFGITGGPVHDVSLRFTRRASPYVAERTWHHSQRLEPLPDGEVVLHMRVGLSPELESWILGFGPDVKVLAPPELAARIRRLHAEAAGLDPADLPEPA